MKMDALGLFTRLTLKIVVFLKILLKLFQHFHVRNTTLGLFLHRHRSPKVSDVAWGVKILVSKFAPISKGGINIFIPSLKSMSTFERSLDEV